LHSLFTALSVPRRRGRQLDAPAVQGFNPLESPVATSRLLLHPDTRGGRAEPSGVPLGRAFLRPEVHVPQPEAVAEPGGPLEVVHRTLLEVVLDGSAGGGGALELRQVRATEQDAVGVVDPAAAGR